VEALDQGIARLGAAAAMMEMAGKLEVDLGRTDAALARFDRASAGGGNPAYWLDLKADAAEQAGRLEQAAETRRAALAIIGQMPDYRRNTAAIAGLEERLRSGLASAHPATAPAAK
jgi:Flp pilus assembly protein TadD